MEDYLWLSIYIVIILLTPYKKLENFELIVYKITTGEIKMDIEKIKNTAAGILVNLIGGVFITIVILLPICIVNMFSI